MPIVAALLPTAATAVAVGKGLSFWATTALVGAATIVSGLISVAHAPIQYAAQLPGVRTAARFSSFPAQWVLGRARLAGLLMWWRVSFRNSTVIVHRRPFRSSRIQEYDLGHRILWQVFYLSQGPIEGVERIYWNTKHQPHYRGVLYSRELYTCLLYTSPSPRD